MKTISFNLILALFMMPVLAFSGTKFDGRHTKEKKISKSFNVSSKALLEIDNSYGNIDIQTWDQNRIEIEVIIRTNGNDEEKVLKRLDEINVNFSHSNSRVSAETRFEKENSSWFSSLFLGFSNINMEINYRVKAPVTNDMNIENDYGSISLDRLEGNANISCDYGSLMIGRLLGQNNLLSFDYTRRSHIDFIQKGRISADYSEYTIEEAGTLEVSADYTDSRITKVENILFDIDYGSIRIDKVRNVKGEGDYLSTKLGAVYHSVDLNLDYGSLSIERLMKSMTKVDITSDYTGIKIGYSQGNPFNFAINTSYASVRGLDGGDFEVNKRNQSNTNNYLEGFYKDSSGGSVTIDSSYGNVTFEN